MKYLLLLAIVLSGCTDESRSQRVLEEAGYTDITLTGYDMWACSDSDHYRTGFRAKGPSGKSTAGAVCCGLTKNCTIRTE